MAVEDREGNGVLEGTELFAFGFPGVPATCLVPQKEGGVFAMSPG